MDCIEEGVPRVVFLEAKRDDREKRADPKELEDWECVLVGVFYCASCR